jgi:hypothetical protein
MKKTILVLAICGALFFVTGIVYAATTSYLIAPSSTTAATQPTTMQHLVRTSDGTMHAFVQQGTQTSTCGGSSKNGLVWMYSTDTGATWICGGQLSSDTTNLMYASAAKDSSDNVYVVYSVAANGGNASYDVYFRKLTKGDGATWTLEAEDTVLEGSASVGYSYAVLEIEGTTRAWLAVRYYDGSNYQVSSHYSGDLAANPSWTVSQEALNTVGTNTGYHIPTIVRFGTKTGIVYNAQLPSVSQRWRFRADSDGLTTWTPETVVSTTTVGGPYFTTITDTGGNIYHAVNNASAIYFSYFNGFAWSLPATAVASGVSGYAVSLATDGASVYVFYGDSTGLSTGLSSPRKWAYKKGVAPYTTVDFDATATNAISHHGVFDKYWSYNGSTYTNDTTDAGNITSADTSMTSGVGSIAYFGKSEKFDAVAWDVSTAASGGTLVWEYWNGEWTTLTFTVSGNTNFQGDGWAAFTDPVDWATTTVNSEETPYYYIRARATVAHSANPVGVELTTIPQVNWNNVWPTVVSNTVYSIWSENASAPIRTKFGTTTVTAGSANTGAGTTGITPYTVGYSSLITASSPSNMRNIIKTSEGTIHAFIQGGNNNVCASQSGSANGTGLHWIYSTDSGATWTCGAQLNADNTYQSFASVTKDASDNMYVVYSNVVAGASAYYDTYFRKLTKGEGTVWSVGSEQTVLDADGTKAYTSAVVEIQGTTRLWLAARYYNGSAYTVVTYYSSDLSAAPVWTVSEDSLDTGGASSAYHFPAIVRFGDKIGVFYDAETAQTRWRFRSDSDSLTSWALDQATGGSTTTYNTWTAVTDTSGNIYLASAYSTGIYFSYWNGFTWTTNVTIAADAYSGGGVTVSTDGNTAWVIYSQTTGLSSGLSGSRKLVYKKITLPFNLTELDTASTALVSYHGTFDKYWSYNGSAYTNDTTDAGNTTNADTQMTSGVGSILYFGKTEKFDAISWDVSTAGTTGQVVWEYFNGDSWKDITKYYGYTNTAFYGDGYLSFVAPDDWATTPINSEATPYYYVRARTTVAYVVNPIGVQVASVPPIYWMASLPQATSNAMQVMWTENVTSPTRVRYAPITITTTAENAASGVELNPVAGYSNTTNATYHSTLRHIVRTSDGTIHTFIQGSSRMVCGGDSNAVNNYGLFWVYSTDNGVTWTCGGQLSSDTSNLMYPSATKDSSDNVYVVYSVATTGVNANYDVFYRKLTKGAGSTWTLGDAQTVLDAASNTAYSFATIEVDSASRGWIATRYMDTNNAYQVSVYYTESLTAEPTWTVSQTTLNTAGFTTADHLPVLVKFGSNIGVIYSAEEGQQRWRYRVDSDGPTSWHTENIVSTINMGAPTFAAVGDTNGNVYHVTNSGAYIYFNYWNGSVWSQNATIVNNTASSGAFVSLSTDGSNVWVFYGDTTGLHQSGYGTRKLMYKKGVLPYTATDFDATATPVISHHTTFDKYWSYVGSSYLDDTTDAASTANTDTQLATGIGDMMYFGKTEKFDTVSWTISTNGASGVLAWEYHNGSSWVPLTNFTTMYRPVMTGHGYVTFQTPSDWATTTVNSEETPYYYIRARVTTAFTITPVAAQVSSIPWLAWPSVEPAPVSNAIHAVWTENATVPVAVRYKGVAVTTLTANTAATANFEIPTTIGYTSLLNGTQPSTMKKMLRTSDGTIHVFVQAGTVSACGSQNDAENKIGLDWIYSTDTGLTWVCGGQLSSDLTYAMYASAVADSSDNIYVVYSTVTTGSNANYDVFFRKLTKGTGSTWTVGTAQTILDAGATSGYSYATIEIEDPTRLWLAVRYYDNANYQVSTYYSDGLTASPSWTVSQLTMETVGTSSAYHYPTLVRYGTNIGVIYNGQTPASMRWRTRADADGLTTWAAESAVSASVVQSPTFTAVGKTDGTVYVAMNVGTSVTFTYWNGSAWSTNAVVSNATAASNTFVGLTMSGANAYVYYGETTGLSAGLSGSRKIMYKKGVSPYATANFDASSTAIVSYHGIFDKYWSYYGEAYTDDTTDAGNSTSADTQLLMAVGDIAYFGKTAKFDAISWDVSTNGTTGQIAWEYYNGSTWVLLTDVLGVSNPTFAADGYISFIPPSDWATTPINSEATAYYYIRARVITAFGVAPVGVQVAAIPQVNWFTTIGNNTNLYWLWMENATAPMRIKTDSMVFNVAPDAPSSLGPTAKVNGSGSTTTQPALEFTITDTNRYDTERFQIQIDDSADFLSPVVDYTSDLAAKGARTFTVGQAAGSGTYTTGAESQTLADGSYYWRVKATDNSSEASAYATANSGSVAFIVDNGNPDVNASELVMLRSAGGTAVTNGTGWTSSDEPYFSWDPGADAAGGSTLLGYCLYLGTSIDGNPEGAKGLLADTSPVTIPAGCDCQFIVDTTSIDLSTALYQGGTWLSTSVNPYYFNIKAVDVVGNVYAGTSAQFAFYYDYEDPTNVAYISPAGGTFSNVVDMSFSWPKELEVASSDDHADVLGWQYQLNSSSGTWQGTTHSTALDLDYIPATASAYYLVSARDGSHVISGSNTVYFRTVDNAGNVSSNATIRTGNIAYGGAAPTFGSSDSVTVDPSTNTTNSFALSWPAATPAEGMSVAGYYYMVNQSPPATYATLTGNVSTYINNGTSRVVTAKALPGVVKGSNTIYVVAVDDAENPNYSPSNTIMGTFTLNSEDPDPVGDLVASDSSIKSTSKWNVALTWTEPVYQGAGNLSYLIHRSSDGITYAQVGTTTGLSYVDTAPSSATYYYIVYTKDGANAVSSATNAVSILPTGRWTTAPTLSSGPVVSSITTKKATITWSTSRSADSKISFGTATNSYGSEEPSNSTQLASHTINLTNLTPGTTYYYKAKWTDEDGNTGTSSESTFTTSPFPIVTDPKASTVGISSAILSYTVSGASKVKIYYGKTANFGGVKEVATATSATTYTTALEELEDGTKYYYKINTFDSELAEYEGSVLTFETLPKPKISTVKIQQVTGTAQSTVLVTWTTNTEVSSIVTYYPADKPADVRDEVNVALTKGNHRMIVRGLLPQTNYMLIVKGRDKIGNEATSDSLKFTTATDTRPPQITDLHIEGSNVPSTSGSSQESTAQLVVSWNTDEPGTSQVEFGEGTGTTYAAKTQEDVNMTLNHLVIITNLTPSKVYHLRALAKDKADNTGMSVDTVTIAPKATDNALNLVISNLQGAFGFLGGLKQ